MKLSTETSLIFKAIRTLALLPVKQKQISEITLLFKDDRGVYKEIKVREQANEYLTRKEKNK